MRCMPIQSIVQTESVLPSYIRRVYLKILIKILKKLELLCLGGDQYISRSSALELFPNNVLHIYKVAHWSHPRIHMVHVQVPHTFFFTKRRRKKKRGNLKSGHPLATIHPTSTSRAKLICTCTL